MEAEQGLPRSVLTGSLGAGPALDSWEVSRDPPQMATFLGVTGQQDPDLTTHRCLPGACLLTLAALAPWLLTPSLPLPLPGTSSLLVISGPSLPSTESEETRRDQHPPG